MFARRSAFFTSSVPQHIIENWIEQQGEIDTIRSASLAFSASSTDEETIQLHTNQQVVFSCQFIPHSIEAKRWMSLGTYLITPQDFIIPVGVQRLHPSYVQGKRHTLTTQTQIKTQSRNSPSKKRKKPSTSLSPASPPKKNSRKTSPEPEERQKETKMDVVKDFEMDDMDDILTQEDSIHSQKPPKPRVPDFDFEFDKVETVRNNTKGEFTREKLSNDRTYSQEVENIPEPPINNVPEGIYNFNEANGSGSSIEYSINEEFRAETDTENARPVVKIFGLGMDGPIVGDWELIGPNGFRDFTPNNGTDSIL